MPDTSGNEGSQEAGLRRMSIVKSPFETVSMDSWKLMLMKKVRVLVASATLCLHLCKFQKQTVNITKDWEWGKKGVNLANGTVKFTVLVIFKHFRKQWREEWKENEFIFSKLHFFLIFSLLTSSKFLYFGSIKTAITGCGLVLLITLAVNK